jgi:hypothetical protein
MAHMNHGENSLHRRLAFIALAAVFFAIPGIAASQGMPWQQPSQVPPAPPPPPGAFYSPPYNPAGQGVHSRVEDDRKLNLLASRFYAIHAATDPRAVIKLRKLEQKVNRFRQQLYQRNYDVTDIANDAQNLENRIARQLRKLQSGTPEYAVPPGAMNAPPPAMPPAAPAPHVITDPSAPPYSPPYSPTGSPQPPAPPAPVSQVPVPPAFSSPPSVTPR